MPVLDAASAVAAAARVAEELAVGAAERDAQRILPAEQLDALSRSGLLGITVPAAYGGRRPGCRRTVAEVIRLLAIGDPNVAQIPHSHFVYVNALREQGTRRAAGVLLRRGAGRPAVRQRPVRGRHQARPRLPHHAAARRATACGPSDGEKGYSTGALFADWIPVLAHLGEDGPMHVAWVERRADGVSVVDDWDGMGQRTTASGTVRLARRRACRRPGSRRGT